MSKLHVRRHLTWLGVLAVLAAASPGRADIGPPRDRGVLPGPRPRFDDRRFKKLPPTRASASATPDGSAAPPSSAAPDSSAARPSPAERAERRRERRRELRERLKQRFSAAGLSAPALRAELSLHARRVALLNRAERLAAGDEKRLTRIAKLREKEQSRHERRLDALKGDGGQP